MTPSSPASQKDRRTFIKEIALAGGAAALAGSAINREGTAFAEPLPAASEFSKKIGLELWTVRDHLTDPKTRQAAFEKVAAIGFREIEPDHGPSGGYLGLSPKDFRALLDRLGLGMPSTHLAVIDGPDLEKQLVGFQIMGLKYVVIAPAATGDIPGQLDAAGAGASPTTAQVKSDCDQLNKYGKKAQKFGMKVLIHNHTTEFAPLVDNKNMCAYDVFLANTDPSLVAMQLDIGWAAVAGQDIVGLFKKTPGRFELWHVKDASNIKLMPRDMSEGERRKIAQLVPVGLGDVDYKTIFANASLAGLKHFCLEQDNAAAWGDSYAAARRSYTNLAKILAA